MPTNLFIGELEQLVLLTILQLGEAGYARSIRQEVGRLAGRSCARGALYRTLDRLESKGMLEWTLEVGTPRRGGHPRRRYRVTQPGIEALKASRSTLIRLWSGLERILE